MLPRSFLASAGERTGVEPLVTTCFGPRTAAGGVHRENLADDEPVAEHADRGQVLLDGRDRSRVSPDVGGHVERGHGLEAEASRLAPREKLPHRPPVRRPRPLVRDPPREELQATPTPGPASTITRGSSMAATPLPVTTSGSAAAGTSASLIRTPLPRPRLPRRRAARTARNRSRAHRPARRAAPPPPSPR